MKELANLFMVLTFVIYFFIESLIVGGVLFFAWNTAFYKFFAVDLSYFNCVFAVWAFKVIRFDLFKFTPHNDDNKQ